MLNPSALTESAEHGDQRPKLPVIGSSGTTPISGNYSPTIGIDWPNLLGREFFLSNDSSGDITITINSIAGILGWVLHAGETFDERTPPFTSVDVTAAGLWRYYVRGNLT